ncbi:MAG: hypothetical protein KDB69_01160 [Acidimicrobiia bacterium]|nr:hypothetical protein [Acidimicrobiia bacterium]
MVPAIDFATRIERAEDALVLGPGQVAGLTGIPGAGLTRLGLSMLVPHVTRGPIAVVDVRGWISPLAAWEMGIDPDRLVIVRAKDIVRWGRVTATLLDGVGAVYAEVPTGIKDAAIRRLIARARTRKTPMVLRPLSGDLPSGAVHVRVAVRSVAWTGTDAGHGRLNVRRIVLDASGRSTRGMGQLIEVEDDGTNDLRVVPHVGAHETRHLA